jgi:hypothetical protein
VIVQNVTELPHGFTVGVQQHRLEIHWQAIPEKCFEVCVTVIAINL